jgi:hypothetical protein
MLSRPTPFIAARIVSEQAANKFCPSVTNWVCVMAARLSILSNGRGTGVRVGPEWEKRTWHSAD